MPIKSKAQRRKFAELLVEGKIEPETYERWNREAGSAELPERVTPKKRTRAKKVTRRSKGARSTSGAKRTRKSKGAGRKAPRARKARKAAKR